MEFPYGQRFNFEGILGRSVSSSYAPARGSATFKAFEDGLSQVFEKFNVKGIVELPYRTELTWGKP